MNFANAGSGFQSHLAGVGWAGLLAPSKTPEAIRAKLYKALVTTMNDKSTHEAMVKLGAEPMATTAEEFAAVIKRDWKAFGDAIRIAGIRPN